MRDEFSQYETIENAKKVLQAIEDGKPIQRYCSQELTWQTIRPKSLIPINLNFREFFYRPKPEPKAKHNDPIATWNFTEKKWETAILKISHAGQARALMCDSMTGLPTLVSIAEYKLLEDEL